MGNAYASILFKYSILVYLSLEHIIKVASQWPYLIQQQNERKTSAGPRMDVLFWLRLEHYI